MNIRQNFRYTKIACYIGYIVQAIVVNFAPLLFVYFNTDFGISLEKIATVSAFNFFIQLTVDSCAAGFVNKLGYRRSAIISQLFTSVGFILYGILPYVLSDPYIGLMIPTFAIAVSGGLIEVLVGPITEACPSDSKSGSMCLLHSFYCWGQAGVILLSTLYFSLFGIDKWYILSFIWALIPTLNALLFLYVPINDIVPSGKEMSLKELFSNKFFALLMILMLCSGASELAMSQWASAFAELGLQTTKSVGDIAGPCLFAILMGISRVIYTAFSTKINLRTFMMGSSILCIISFALACFSPLPLLGLVGCALCGFSVGILWPGTISIAAKSFPRGGTMMFGILALSGDIGCTVGTLSVGFFSGILGDDLKKGLIFGMVFPIIMTVCLLAGKRSIRI